LTKLVAAALLLRHNGTKGRQSLILRPLITGRSDPIRSAQSAGRHFPTARLDIAVAVIASVFLCLAPSCCQ